MVSYGNKYPRHNARPHVVEQSGQCARALIVTEVHKNNFQLINLSPSPVDRGLPGHEVGLGLQGEGEVQGGAVRQLAGVGEAEGVIVETGAVLGTDGLKRRQGSYYIFNIILYTYSEDSRDLLWHLLSNLSNYLSIFIFIYLIR